MLNRLNQALVQPLLAFLGRRARPVSLVNLATDGELKVSSTLPQHAQCLEQFKTPFLAKQPANKQQFGGIIVGGITGRKSFQVDDA